MKEESSEASLVSLMCVLLEPLRDGKNIVWNARALYMHPCICTYRWQRGSFWIDRAVRFASWDFLHRRKLIFVILHDIHKLICTCIVKRVKRREDRERYYSPWDRWSSDWWTKALITSFVLRNTSVLIARIYNVQREKWISICGLTSKWFNSLERARHFYSFFFRTSAILLEVKRWDWAFKEQSSVRPLQYITFRLSV